MKRDEHKQPPHDPDVEHEFVDGRWRAKPKLPDKRRADRYEIQLTIVTPTMEVPHTDYNFEDRDPSEVIAMEEAVPERVREIISHLIETTEDGQKPFEVRVNVRPLWT